MESNQFLFFPFFFFAEILRLWAIQDFLWRHSSYSKSLVPCRDSKVRSAVQKSVESINLHFIRARTNKIWCFSTSLSLYLSENMDDETITSWSLPLRTVMNVLQRKAICFFRSLVSFVAAASGSRQNNSHSIRLKQFEQSSSYQRRPLCTTPTRWGLRHYSQQHVFLLSAHLQCRKWGRCKNIHHFARFQFQKPLLAHKAVYGSCGISFRLYLLGIINTGST